MNFIQLTMVVGEADDGLGQPTELTCPTMVDPTQIRSFNPRKYGKRGTRIVFRSGAAMPVTELFEEVVTKLAVH